MAKIGVPSIGGVTSGLKSYGWGAGFGILYNVLSGLTGSGLVGSALSAGVASAVVKGEEGKVITAMLGFQAGAALGNPLALLGGGGGGQSGPGVI